MQRSIVKVSSILVILGVLLAGCGRIDKIEAVITGYAKNCIGGVLYYQFTSGAAPAYTIDGKLVACR
jgi:hypothetical protein